MKQTARSHQILIVGTGSIGERHLRCFQATSRVDVVLCEINDECRKAIADRYGLAQTYPDLDTALEDAFDASVVATPAHLHVLIATRLAGAGHHLLIEKPLSTGLDRDRPAQGGGERKRPRCRCGLRVPSTSSVGGNETGGGQRAFWQTGPDSIRYRPAFSHLPSRLS